MELDKNEKNERLNQSAMQIILHSGDGRELIHKAIKKAISNTNLSNEVDKEVSKLIENAEYKIQEAHKIQTTMIQSSIEDDYETTLLFAHAQDTLMTIYTELHMSKHIISLIKTLRREIKEETLNE